RLLAPRPPDASPPLPHFCSHHALPPRAPPSSPTRRSSDLVVAMTCQDVRRVLDVPPVEHAVIGVGDAPGDRPDEPLAGPIARVRSEEHTSELQSLTNIVCRLLLEKKKARKQNPHTRSVTSL